MNANRRFMEKLRKVRESHGLTRVELATQIGVTAQSVWTWEDGRTTPTPKNLWLWAAALNVPIPTNVFGRRPGERYN